MTIGEKEQVISEAIQRLAKKIKAFGTRGFINNGTDRD